MSIENQVRDQQTGDDGFRITALRSAALGRKRRDRTVSLVLGLLMVITVAVLVWVLVYVAVSGIKALSPSFFTQTPPGNPSSPGGGFANGIIGSLIIVGIATAISVPIGIATAIYLVEYATGRVGEAVRFISDLLVGIPTIVTGAFVYAFWVAHFGFSGIAGGIALAIVMLPLVVKGTEEVLKLVPNELREASLALGITESRTILTVLVPAAISGIITSVMLAVARAMGETAPLLLTALGNDLFIEANPTRRMSTLSLQIFDNAITGYRTAQARAWAGALTLIFIVIILTVIARYFGRRARY